MGNIVVLGSFMMDMVTNCKRIPQDGETVIGNSFTKNPGGKGANQAVTISRLGKTVIFVGMVGNDENGDEARKILHENNVNVDHLLSTSKGNTGVGCVWVNETGSNRIIVVPGANQVFNEENFQSVKNVILNAELLVLQLEMNLNLISHVIDFAHEVNVPVLLNPAPAAKLSDETIANVDYLTPNESELSSLTGMPVSNDEEVITAVETLLDKGVKNVIVTLGDKGAIWIDKDKNVARKTGYKVDAVDTVGAGDSFNGALAYGISEHMSKSEILEFANKVGALTVTGRGAIKSIPNLKDVKEFENMVLQRG